jgi:hypothetical protein
MKLESLYFENYLFETKFDTYTKIGINSKTKYVYLTNTTFKGYSSNFEFKFKNLVILTMDNLNFINTNHENSIIFHIENIDYV